MDNVLVFTSDFSVVKLTDFGSTRKAGTLVRRRHELLPYCPPEVAEAVYNEGYHVSTSQDVWQLGIMMYVLLTGALPWQKADETTDKLYAPYYAWQQRRTSKVPSKFKEFTARLQRLFRRTLDPKEETRVSVKGRKEPSNNKLKAEVKNLTNDPFGFLSSTEFFKYTDDKWMARRNTSWLGLRMAGTGEGRTIAGGDCQNPLLISRYQHPQYPCGAGGGSPTINPSILSVHSCEEEKNRIFRTLTQYGIETVVDRTAKKERIRDWIQSSCVYRNQLQQEQQLLTSPADPESSYAVAATEAYLF